MSGMNPFGVGAIHESPLRSPSGHGPVLTRDAAPPGGSARRGRATRLRPEALPGGDEAPAYETRRSDLYPEVRSFADKLHAKILGIYKKYGATNIREMLENAEAGKGPKLKRQDVEEISKSLDALNFTLLNNELPPGQRELPPLEVFQKALEKINDDVLALNAHVVGLDPWDEYELIDGKLNGRFKVHLSDLRQDRWFPVINSEIVESIDGRVVLDGADVRNKGGKMNGRVNIGGDHWLPVIDGELIRSINGQGIENCMDVRNVGGKLNGAVDVGSGYWLAVIGGKPVREIKGRKIHGRGDVRNIGGKLNGVVGIGGHDLPVIAGELVESIDDKEIEQCRNVRNVGNKLNGEVKIGDRWLPVIAGELIEEIDGQKIDDCVSVRNIGNKLNARVKIGDRWLPIIEGEPILEIGGLEIQNCGDVRNMGGKLNGMVTVGGPYLPVINGDLIEAINGLKIKDIASTSVSEAGGTLSGDIIVEDMGGHTSQRHVLLGKIIK